MPQPIDVEPGRYVMEIRGHWRDHGNTSFYFPIELVDPAVDEVPTTSDVGVIRCKPDGSTVVQTPQVAVRRTACTCGCR